MGSEMCIRDSLSRMEGAYEGSEVTAKGAIDALFNLGGGQGRETVAYIAQDSKTSKTLLEYANKTLGQGGEVMAQAEQTSDSQSQIDTRQ